MLSRQRFRIEYLIFFIAIAARLVPGPRTVDDAYITFRYSQNLLDGAGLVYNPGEAVLGTTTPLFAIVLTFFGFAFSPGDVPFPHLSLGINAVSDAVSCMILLNLGRRFGFPRAGAISSILWALSPMSVTFAIGGMETSFFIMLMLGSLYMHSIQRPVCAALLAACSLLTRPDALLAVAPLLAARSLQVFHKTSNRPTFAEVLAFLVPIGVWAGVGFFFYGSPIPQSVSAKSLAYNLPSDAALIRLLQHFATPFQGNLIFGPYYIAFGLLFFPALSIIGWRRALRASPHSWPLAVFPLLYFLAYSIANPLIFRWYLAPPLPLYIFGFMVGLEAISSDAKLPSIQIGFTTAFLLLTINTWTLRPDHGPQAPAPKMAYIKLEELYFATIEDLDLPAHPELTIAAGDIGVIGYYSQARILDLVGLVSPQTTRYFPLPSDRFVINYAIPPGVIMDFKPELIIILEVYGRRTLLIDAEFQRSYRLIKEYPTDIYSSKAMLVFELRD